MVRRPLTRPEIDLRQPFLQNYRRVNVLDHENLPLLERASSLFELSNEGCIKDAEDDVHAVVLQIEFLQTHFVRDII